jgi:hypothetical protein
MTTVPAAEATVDIGEAFKFLKLIDPRARAFTFQAFREKGDARDIVPQVIHGRDLSEVARKHAAGAGVHIVINETDGLGRKSKNIVRVRAVWQEDDDGYTGCIPPGPQHRRRVVARALPSLLVGNDWPADERGRADFASVMERMVETYGSDKNAKDISRVMRLPGFLHRKADKGPINPFLVRIVEATGKRYMRAEIRAAFPPVPREPREPIKVWEWKSCGDGWLRGLVRTVANAVEGQRNSTLFWAACRARDRVADGSADEGFITDVLLEAAHHAGLPQLEAQRTIRSGMRGSHD